MDISLSMENLHRGSAVVDGGDELLFLERHGLFGQILGSLKKAHQAVVMSSCIQLEHHHQIASAIATWQAPTA